MWQLDLDTFFFGYFPYLAVVVFLVGSFARFEREQYTWKSESSQLLKRSTLRWGSNLFHIGILSLMATHLVGLLTPLAVFHAFGITVAMKQLMAIIGGAVLGLTCLAGMLLLIWRRISEPRIWAVTRNADIVTLLWLLMTLGLGLLTIFTSIQHKDGHTMLALMDWAKHIVTLQTDAASFMKDVPLVYKAHMIMGMSLFILFPFTRLVHVFSGFGAVTYLVRSWQLVRGR